uniref:Uncharacterized protein n=1 Tax=viral metagenome TaxID=1070528 RepID=A0A6C0DZU3_9ZZZZ
MALSKLGNLYDSVACVESYEKSIDDIHRIVLAALQELIHILESSQGELSCELVGLFAEKALIDEVAKFCKIQEVTKPLLLDDQLIIVHLPMTAVRVPGYVPKIAPGRSVAIEEDYFKWSFVNPHEIQFFSFSWRGDVSVDVSTMELGKLLIFLKFIADKFSTDPLTHS